MLLQEVHILRYLWNVYRELPGNRSQKEAILSRVEDSVRTYATENPRLDYAAIVARFGDPCAVAESCVEEMETAELVKNLRVRRKVVSIVVAAAVAIVILWVGVVASALAEHFISVGGHIEHRIVDVIEIPYENGG